MKIMCKKYDEFVSTREMIERIKDIISIPKGEHKVFQNDVAGVLGINEGNLSTMAKRDSPPIAEILLFCRRWGFDVNEIVFKKRS